MRFAELTQIALLGTDRQTIAATTGTTSLCQLESQVGGSPSERVLLSLAALPPSPLEQQEKLEQLRALEAGMRIDITLVDSVPRGVDTPADLETARKILAKAY